MKFFRRLLIVMSSNFYSKKELSIRFNISYNSVYRTLKVCGLSTTKRRYSADEVTLFFAPARNLFNSGKTRKEVAEYFKQKALYRTVYEQPPLAG